MSLQYISDESGHPTAVIIPIEEWNAIVQTHTDLRELDKSTNNEKKIKISEFQDIFSEKEANKFHKYLTKVRKEWDRDFY